MVNGHVIITSRDPNWGDTANTIGVEVFRLSEAVEFLLKRTKQQDEESAKKSAQELGCLPLALAQAGAYIDTKRVTIARYLELFLSKRKELWAKEKGTLGYEKTVSATLNLAIEHVVAESPTSVDLLKLCAFMGPDDIPLTVLNGGQEHLPERLRATVADELEMNEAIGALRRYSLVEVDEGKESLSVHRLVQAVVRDGLEEDESKVWAEAAVDVVEKAFPYGLEDVRTWVECARLLPHALTTTGYIEKAGVLSEIAGRLLDQVGNYLAERAQYVEAKSALERALSIMNKAHGVAHPTFASTLSNLGMVLKDLGDLEGAKTHYERALAINQKAFGPDHPTVAICVNNLSGVLFAWGDFEGAKMHLERALAIDEKAFGLDHPNVASGFNNLGMVLKDLGNLEGAKMHLERALAINQKALGPDHPNVANDVNNLGGVLQELGDFEGAKAHFERALTIGEKAFDLNHPQLALYVNNLGLVLQDLGDLQGAKMHLERALRIFRQFLPEEHRNIAAVRGNLDGVVYLLARKASGGK
jgi:tetratricopeptide (TPR) repeat protein